MLDALIVETHPTMVGSMTELDDVTLVQHTSHQDTAAFEVLYRRFHPRVYNFIFRMTRNTELTEEATADTLYAVWKSAASFKHKSAVSTWILGIAYKTALKTLEKNSRHTQKRDQSDLLETVEDSHPDHDPARVTGTLMESDMVQQAILKLSPEQQAVVQLTATGHSCSEISSILDCPTNTVKTRMFHARKLLQRHLQFTAGVKGD
ncbi:MAG: sigma-70 family RNA polymerase sigma factor [Granulosicoccus sp.]|nr:sigma-70 family RNA polymerase sigma factor [Granulosicoccus sp.]